MEATERSPVNSVISPALTSSLPPPPPPQLTATKMISSPSSQFTFGEGECTLVKDWLPGFPSGPVNRRSAATWGLVQISGEQWGGGGTMICSRLCWFWVYKGSQRLENHRCQ